MLKCRVETDIPVPADYNGDGRADQAIFRDGVWYVLKSTDGANIIEQFGMTGDRPTPNAYVN